MRGANVVMGNDPECSNWIANYRDPAADGEARVGVVGSRADVVANKPRPLVVFMPSGKRGRFPRGTAVLRPRAAWASMSIRSVAGARFAVAARSRSRKAICQARNHFDGQRIRRARPKQRFRTRRGLGAGRRLSCQALLQQTSLSMSLRVRRCIIRSYASRTRLTTSRSIRLCTPTLSRCRSRHARGAG